jgi:hypothetical protein
MALRKTCTKCNETKSLDEFAKRGKNLHRSRCKDCTNDKAREEQTERNNTIQLISCLRCGVMEPVRVGALDKRAERGHNGQCSSCNARPMQQIRRGSKGDFCRPWHGEFDDNDNPMKNGRYYLPGERVCGHRDCVNKKHIVMPEIPDGHKPCSNCGEVQPLAEYGIDRKKADGLNCECRTCRAKRDRERSLTLMQYGKDGETYNDFVKRIEKERRVA